MAKRKILIIAAVAVCVVLGACLAAGAFSGKQNNSGVDQNDPSDMVSTHELFSTIMSSPATSSASNDYLIAHEAEHRKLLEDKEKTLRYIFKVFLDAEKHGTPENGLHGVLMRTVLDELSPELMLDLVATPQEYFDAWKDMALKQQGDHSDNWLKQNYPAAYILKQVLAE